MKICTLMALLGFFLGAFTSEISPEEVAEPRTQLRFLRKESLLSKMEKIQAEGRDRIEEEEERDSDSD